MIEGLRARGHRHVVALDDPVMLTAMIGPLTEPGDLVVCLGAGTITQWAHALPDDLSECRKVHCKRKARGGRS